MESLIEKMIDNIESSKFMETIRLESIDNNSSILETTLNPPIKLDPTKHYKVGLRFFTMYNFITNINNTNNVFRYSHDNGTTWNSITLLEGAYEFSQIVAELNRQMKISNHWDLVNDKNFIEIVAKGEINKIVIDISSPNYQLDRNVNNTITEFFGFNKNATVLSQGYNIAENNAQISNVSTIDLECNLITGGIVGGNQKQIIYDMPSFSVPIGYKIIEQPAKINYFPLNTTTLKNIRIRIIDENGNLLNIPGEKKIASLKILQV